MEENGFKNFTIGVILPGVFAENYRKEYSVCYAHNVVTPPRFILYLM